MKQLLALMAFLFFLILVVSGVMAVGNVKQSEQIAQRTQQISELKAELRAAEQLQQNLTRQLTALRSRNAELRTTQASFSRRLGDMLALTRSQREDSADLRAAFAATGAASPAATAAWLSDISGALDARAALPLQGEELLQLNALENVLRRLMAGQAGGVDSGSGAAVAERDAAIAERDTAIADRDAAITERDTAITERDTAITERDAVITERDTAIVDRDAAIAERDTAITERDAAITERDSAIAERDTAITERDAAIAQRNTVFTQGYALLIQNAAAAVMQNTAASLEDRLSLLPQATPDPAPTAAPASVQPAGSFAPTGSGREPVLLPIGHEDPETALLAVLRRASAEAAGGLRRLLKPLHDQLSRLADGLLDLHPLP